MPLHGIQYGGEDPAYQTKYICILFGWQFQLLKFIFVPTSAVIMIFIANIVKLCYFFLYCYHNIAVPMQLHWYLKLYFQEKNMISRVPVSNAF